MSGLSKSQARSVKGYPNQGRHSSDPERTVQQDHEPNPFEKSTKITGYDNQAQSYCAMTGGKVDLQAGACLSADGNRCGLDEYFTGACPSP
jgi:putative hemolysin